MSLTLLAWVAAFIALAALAFAHPIFGVLGYMLEYYQRPDLFWWGKPLPDLRWNMVISTVLFVSVALHYSRLPALPKRRSWAMLLLIGLILNTFLVTNWAVAPVQSLDQATKYSKVTAVAIAMHLVVRTPLTLHAVGGAHILGATFWGIDALDKKRVRGRLEGIGSSDTNSSNGLAIHLLTVMPWVALWLLAPPHPWCRYGAVVAAPFVGNLFILANSRGSMLGLLVGCVYIFVVAGRGMRFKMLAASALGLTALYLLADPQFIARQQTTAAADDSSAEGRLTTWQRSFDMIRDYPRGVGGKGFQVLSPVYLPEVTDRYGGQGRSAHNTYIQTTADWGLQGGLLYIALAISIVHSLRNSRKRSAATPGLRAAAVAVEGGFIAFLTAAVFGDYFSTESFYWTCAIALSIERLTLAQLVPNIHTRAPSGLEMGKGVTTPSH